MTEGSFVPLAGQRTRDAFRRPGHWACRRGERIEVTLVIRRRAELPAELVTGPATISTEELASSYGTDPADIDRAARDPGRLRPGGHQHASRFPPDQGGRHRGPADAGVRHDAAPRFQPGPGRYRAGGAPLPRGPPGGPGRAGRDRDRGPGAGQPAAGKPAFPAVRGGRDPVLVYAAAGGAGLRFPAGTDGTGQTIAILEFGGGFSASDLQSYFSGLSLPVPSVTAASVDGASNAPGLRPGRRRRRGAPGYRGGGLGGPRRGAGGVLRAQHGPGVRRRDQCRRARHARPRS